MEGGRLQNAKWELQISGTLIIGKGRWSSNRSGHSTWNDSSGIDFAVFDQDFKLS